MRSQINRLLQSNGLGRLEEGAALMSQLGFLVRDHDHFRSMLITCPLDQRRNMYESLRSYLRFPAKPLDVYESEAAADAEARQLPIQAADGTLKPFNPPELHSDTEIAQFAVDEAMAKKRLVLVCRKCTREEVFVGQRKADVVYDARNAGWVYDENEGVSYEICPDCPAGRAQ